MSFGESRHVVCTPQAFTTWSRKSLCRNPRGIFPKSFQANLRGIFGWVFWAPLPWNKSKKPPPKSTAKFKSNFGSFAAKIHTARIWSSYFPACQYHSKRLRQERVSGEFHTTQHKFGIKDCSCNRDELNLEEGQGCREVTLIKSPIAACQEEPRGDSKTLQPSNCEIEVTKQTTL